MRPLARTIDAEPAGLHTCLPSAVVTHRGPGSSNGAAKLPPTEGSTPAECAGTPPPNAVRAASTGTRIASLRIAPPELLDFSKALIDAKVLADDHLVAIPGGAA